MYGQAYRSFEIVARPSPNHFFFPILGGLGDVLKKKGTKKRLLPFRRSVFLIGNRKSFLDVYGEVVWALPIYLSISLFLFTRMAPGDAKNRDAVPA